MPSNKPLTSYDLLTWVQCWVPLGDRVEVARLGGVQRERGAAGVLDAWAVRRAGRYAIAWTEHGRPFVHGSRGIAFADNPRDPIMDRAALLSVVTFGTRKAAVASLA